MKWVNRQSTLYSDISLKKKICGLPFRTVVPTTGLTDGMYEQVLFDIQGKTVSGWVHTDDLEDYVRNFPHDIVVIENQTPNTNDFEQYMMHKSIKQVNMCGELCVCEILGISLGTLLSKWESSKPNFFSTVFGSGKANGIGPDDLKTMFEIFERTSEPLTSALYQYHIKRYRYTIKALSKLLERGSVIASVHISGQTGLIQPSGVLHWVGLKHLISERNGQGMVTFYNPAMNCIESCSWNEFMASAIIPYGVFVPNIS